MVSSTQVQQPEEAEVDVVEAMEEEEEQTNVNDDDNPLPSPPRSIDEYNNNNDNNNSSSYLSEQFSELEGGGVEDDEDNEEDEEDEDDDDDTGTHGDGDMTSSSHTSDSTKSVTKKQQDTTLSMVRLFLLTILFTLAAIVSNITFIIAHNKELKNFHTHLETYFSQTIQLSVIEQLQQYEYIIDMYITSITTTTIEGSHNNNNNLMILPNFGIQTKELQTLVQSTMIWWGPILYSNQERMEWESYVTNEFTSSSSSMILMDDLIGQQQQLSSSSSLSTTTTTFYDTGRTVSQGIYRMENGQAITEEVDTTSFTSEDDSTWYAPIWQIAAAATSQIQTITSTSSSSSTTSSSSTSTSTSTSNSSILKSLLLFNQGSELIRKQVIEQVMKTKGSVWTPIFYNSTNDSIHYQYNTPTSAYYIPLFDETNETNEPEKKKIIGIMTVTVHWQSLLERAIQSLILPVDTPDVPVFIVTLENSCGQVFSYQVVNSIENTENTTTTTTASSSSSTMIPKVTFLGVGDGYHTDLVDDTTNSTTYHFDLENIQSFVQIQNNNDQQQTDEELEQEDQTLDLNFNTNDNDKNDVNSFFFLPSSSICSSHTIRIHPTKQLKNVYVTNRPDYLQGGIALVFLVTCAIFIGYDCLVERRQRKLVQSAKQTRALVNSLFPSNVRDRLYAEQQEEQKREQQQQKKLKKQKIKASLANMQTPKLRLKSYLDGTNTNNNTNGGTNNGGTTSHGRSSSMKQTRKYDGGNGNNNDTIKDYGAIALADLLASSEPIADLFPRATVLSADIAGFTAWSSEREPSQVFTLLESMFGVMDKAAQKLHVFKVETIGDCYVAATGLPDPQPDHAVRMARFANTCLLRVQKLVQALEVSLGPGTGDLALRFGIHSGPVTAGVLRGEKSRFQLFGDTLDLASQMESTGIKNRIHLSQDTAELLVQSGKSHWIVPRNDNVDNKSTSNNSNTNNKENNEETTTTNGSGWTVLHNGKSIQTFWLQMEEETHRRRSSSKSMIPTTGTAVRNIRLDSVSIDEADELVDWGDADIPIKAEEKTLAEVEQVERLIDWNVDTLQSILRRVVARRNALYQNSTNKRRVSKRLRSSSVTSQSSTTFTTVGDQPLDEVQEVVELPEFDPSLPGLKATDAAVKLSKEVQRELRDYVSQIAAGYKLNPFHNFEHASHVCLSSNKLLKRILQSDAVDYAMTSKGRTIADVASDLHNHTYGISSDPLTHLAIVFSALIHDVGHTGVPNPTLAKEHPEIAARYHNQSIAEQRSVDIAWELLMAPCYGNLRKCIFATEKEQTQFRSLVVNIVLATDIFDKELGALRKARWAKAFADTSNAKKDDDDEMAEVREALRKSQNQILGRSPSSDDNDAKVLNPQQLAIFNTDMNRKATIVIEHIIQASDVSHTMQHWHIYQRWNERLFSEMYRAYQGGRSDKDPSEGWYNGELWFFDNYVIPLAHKLKDCGVFGVSCDEYLNYALNNRSEWERKGKDVVANMVANLGK